MNKIYIDMDGTLTPYDYADYKDDKWKHHPSILCKPPIITNIPPDFVILTCVATCREAILKKSWAKHYFPNNQLITCFSSKYKEVDAKDSILIDDYNKNLDEWKAAGGIPIKFLNGINSPRKDMLCVRAIEGTLERCDLNDNY
jgi:hypothetical protein